MRRLTRDFSMALGFVVFSFLLAFLQRPGSATSDTKIDLHVDPGTFLGEVASAWSPTLDLGSVQSAQYTGFLWPMSSVFAGLDALGLSPWVAQRIWLGALFAISAVGVLKLLDAMAGKPRGVVHLVAALFYVLNPYVVVFTGRTTATLVGYAALPWLLLAVVRGVRAVKGSRGWRDWRSWWWPAVFALVLTSSGGGINGAVVGWMLVGPLVLLAYEPLRRTVRWRDSGAFLMRAGVLGGLASAWWIVPLFIHARFGADFLQFTEQPSSIWAVNTAPEALRLMSYWTTYVGVGFSGPDQPLFTEAGTLLFNPLVVGASLLLPALAVGGLLLSRRRPYAAFFLLILLVGAAIEVAGFPNGTPIRGGMEWVYSNFPLLRFMRTTQKAAPLVALGTAGLLGLGLRMVLVRARELPWPALRRAVPIGAPAVLLALVVLAALPLVRGTAVDRQVTWDRIPPAWTQAGSDLDRDLAPNTRAVVLPGQIFAYYRWGSTVDSILPRVTKRPVAVRYETPYADPHATDVLWTVDRLVQQRRLVPGQLAPLLDLMGAGAVVTGSDDNIRRSGALDPAAAAQELADQDLGRPDRSYGPRTPVGPGRGELGPRTSLPQVRRYDLGTRRGIVAVEPLTRPVIVDGGAEGLAAMAAFGDLPRDRAIFYAADLPPGELARDARAGSDVVVTDSNRRRRFVPEYARQNLGETLPQKEQLSDRYAAIEPFITRGPDAQTVSVLSGARYLDAPNEGGLLEFPERRPFAAFDGDRSTAWAADRYLRPATRWIEIGFERPRDVPWVELEPIRDRYGIEAEVDINGRKARLRPGVNRVRVDLERVSKLRVTLTRVIQPRGNLRGSGGFREIRIPGVRVEERLRAPVVVGRALAGRDMRRSSLSYVLERTTADDPFRRDRFVGSPLLEHAADRSDSEPQLDRVLFAPEARRYRASAWVHPGADAPDPALDRIVGMRSKASFTSSSRFRNLPRDRASSAFDGSASTGWVGIWTPRSAPRPWLAWDAGRATTLSRLRIQPPVRAVSTPATVRLSWPGGSSGPVRVGRDGSVALPRPVRASRFRLTVLRVRPPVGRGEVGSGIRAVGIGELRGRGMPRAQVPRTGSIRSRCGDASIGVGRRPTGLRAVGTVSALDAGRPLRARGCGETSMGAGVQRVRSLPGPFSVHLLQLKSPAPVADRQPVIAPGRVLDGGKLGGSKLTGAGLALTRPAWIVLGQGYSPGWRANCDGRSLGKPRPINGYANGWRAPANCRQVDFSFAPQRAALAGFGVSALTCLVLLIFLLAGRRGPHRGPVELFLLGEESEVRLPLPRAAALALAVTVPLMLLFALRSGLVIFPLLTLVFWRGTSTRALLASAALLLGVAVPLAYAITSPTDRGGYNFEYGSETIWAHWIGVLALVLLFVACWRLIRARLGPAETTGPA